MSDSGLADWVAPSPPDVPETPEELLRALGGPTWIHLPGRDRARTRAVSTLLHGNEPSGLRAVHAWLRSGRVPATDVVILLGAVEAALAPPGFAHRMLPGRRDLNRCFREPFAGREGALAREVLTRLDALRPEALVDLHNNTGHNPPYGVAPRLDDTIATLVSRFAHRLVHSDLRLGALVEATAPRMPSVTIECGRAGDPAADAVARTGLARFLSEEEPCGPTGGPIALYRDPVRVAVRPGTTLAVADAPAPDADVTLRADVDRHNFEELAPGTRLGWVRDGAPWPLVAAIDGGADVSRELFERRDGALLARRAMTPIMMTTDPRIALADCLFYAVRPAGTWPPGAGAPRSG